MQTLGHVQTVYKSQFMIEICCNVLQAHYSGAVSRIPSCKMLQA